MAQPPPLRDYIYVSVRKVDRLAAAVPAKRWRRLRELNFTAGPVGAGFAVADAPAQTAVGQIPAIEAALYDQREVYWVDDPRLAAGNWFTVSTMPMAYGVQRLRSGTNTSAAVFVGSTGNDQVLLSGTVEHLLDRRVREVDIGDSMSDPQAITRLLQGLGDDDEPRVSGNAESSYAHSDDYPIANALKVLGSNGMYPLTFLARAMRVTPTRADAGREPNARNIVGSPLWVAFA